METPAFFAARGLLPLARGGEALARPFGERLGVQERDVDHRVIRLVRAKIPPAAHGLFRAERRVGGVGDFGLVDIESRQGDGLLVFAEQERPGGHQNHIARGAAEGLRQARVRRAAAGAVLWRQREISGHDQNHHGQRG